MENLLVAINCVLPAFLMICLGALIRSSEKMPEQFFMKISGIVFRYLLPCLLFYSIYTTDISTVFDPALLGFLVVFLLVWYLVGFVLSTLLVKNHRTRSAFIQTFFRSNIAIIGISMADAMMGAPGVAAMSMAVAVMVPIFNILAVIALEVCRGEKVNLRDTLLGIVKNPLLISCVLGLLFLLLKIPVPDAVLTAVGQTGTAGSVMALVTLGASFRLSGVRRNLKKLVCANLLRLFITPLIAVVSAVLLGFRGNALGVVLLSFAPALATASYPMAIAEDSDHELTGQIVVTSSFFCCITMFLWIFFLKQMGLL